MQLRSNTDSSFISYLTSHCLSYFSSVNVIIRTASHISRSFWTPDLIAHIPAPSILKKTVKRSANFKLFKLLNYMHTQNFVSASTLALFFHTPWSRKGFAFYTRLVKNRDISGERTIQFRTGLPARCVAFFGSQSCSSRGHLLGN